MSALADRNAKMTPTFAAMLSIAMITIGIVGYARLGVDRFPAVDLPSVRIQTRLPGASPEEVETELTDVIEEAVNTVSGIDELRSVSSEGVSQVIVAFLLEKDADTAAQEVRDRVNRVLPLLPKTIDQPTVEGTVDPVALPDEPMTALADIENDRVDEDVEDDGPQPGNSIHDPVPTVSRGRKTKAASPRSRSTRAPRSGAAKSARPRARKKAS